MKYLLILGLIFTGCIKKSTAESTEKDRNRAQLFCKLNQSVLILVERVHNNGLHVRCSYLGSSYLSDDVKVE